MKRLGIILIAFLLLLPLAYSATGCASTDNGKIKIVATIFPIYDWVMVVLGDHAEEAEVTFLANKGGDMHSYKPSAFSDVRAIADADLFLYVGGESDEWVEDALKNATNKNRRTMALLELLGERALSETSEGIAEPEGEEGEEEEEEAYDEHVWLSVKNAAFYVDLIAQELATVDPSHAEDYRRNADAYIAKLNDLDARYQAMVAASERDTILIADRFPFLYLTHDYDINYYAAFAGCSANTAKLSDYKFLYDKVDELDLKVILILENSSDAIAKNIRAGSASKDQEILVLDSLQSVTQKDYDTKGRSYLSAMENNLETLERALAA